MDTNAIINAAMQQLVDTVADAVICKLKAEGKAQATLEPEALASSLLTLLETDTDIREAMRNVFDDKIDEFESRITELEDNGGGTIDADDSDFRDAVCSVIRNSI